VTAGQEQPPRVLIDANILISVLVSPDAERSAAIAVFNMARSAAIRLLVTYEVIEELARVVREKPWLAQRILPVQFESFVNELSIVAETLPRLDREPPRICRDPGDDFLVAHAVLADADYLVTRDKDLLDLVEIGDVLIVDPGTFLSRLRELDSG
jgi:putative PIN family toxin of toxin-antitoxin system